MSIIDILIQFRPALLEGFWVTLKLCSIIWSIGLVTGSALGAAGARWALPVGAPCRVASFLLSAVPILVLLFWMHYPVQAILGVVVDPFYTAALSLTVVNIFAVADVVRAGAKGFPAEYLTAARVCGLTPWRTMLHIQLPILLRQLVPSLLMQQVNMLQATLLSSLIGVEEMFRVAQRINAVTYRPIQVYSTLAVFLLIICLPLNGLATWLKVRFTRDLSDR